MIPQTFKNTDPQAIFVLRYVDGSEDWVGGVKVEDDVIVVAYPSGHGSGLHGAHIESETEDEIRFMVAKPQLWLLDGVVTLKRTGERWT
ncbi:MAG: hypothetical protein WA208_02150 [Thermoanaerobaculia bacterium]